MNHPADPQTVNFMHSVRTETTELRVVALYKVTERKEKVVVGQ